MKTNKVIQGSMIAAMYIVLTLVSASLGLANGAIQIRLSEALTILPFFTPSAIWGLFAGCLVSNIITGCMILDTIFGSIATLIGGIATFYVSRLRLKNKIWLTPVGPIVSNTIIIPLVLSKVYGLKDALWFLCLTVGIGEVISCGILGMILLFSLSRHKDVIFGK